MTTCPWVSKLINIILKTLRLGLSLENGRQLLHLGNIWIQRWFYSTKIVALWSIISFIIISQKSSCQLKKTQKSKIEISQIYYTNRNKICSIHSDFVLATYNRSIDTYFLGKGINENRCFMSFQSADDIGNVIKESF